VKPGRWIADRLGLGLVAAEIIKQTIDQPLHVAMCVASVCAIGCAAFWAGAHSLWAMWIAERGMPADLLLISTILGECGTVLWVALREVSQWPSSRWWDPPLDWAFEAVGCAAGGVLFWLWLAPLLI